MSSCASTFIACALLLLSTTTAATKQPLSTLALPALALRSSWLLRARINDALNSGRSSFSVRRVATHIHPWCTASTCVYLHAPSFTQAAVCCTP